MRAPTAAVIDHTFRIARGAGRVVQRNRIPFGARRCPDKVRVILIQKFIVGSRADPHRLSKALVDYVDHENIGPPRQFDGLCCHLGKLRIDNENLGFCVVQDESHRPCIQTRIDRVKNRA